jgi:GNAT superfamily N-acetyltransferase
MIFKELETDHEWSEAIALRNIYNWTNPGKVSEARSYHQRSKQDRVDLRFVGMTDEQMSVYGGVMQNRNAGDGTYWFILSFDPNKSDAKATFRLATEESERRIKGYGGTRAMIESRGEITWEKEVLLDLGYTKDMRLPFSGLEVVDTNFELQSNVLSFRQFLDLFPDDGLHEIWRLEMDCANDLPLPFPFVETPFETFINSITDPEVDLDCKFILFEDGELKGMTQLWPSKVNTKLASTGLTGTRRQFRRQRVATRLKQHSTAWAKDRGIERIFTDNEENNPMYQLNLQLGFRPLFDYEVYSKAC